MDDPTLQRRLDAIERRQYYILALLVLPYFFAALGMLFQIGNGNLLLSILFGGVVMVVLAGAYIGYQGRQPSRR